MCRHWVHDGMPPIQVDRSLNTIAEEIGKSVQAKSRDRSLRARQTKINRVLQKNWVLKPRRWREKCSLQFQTKGSIIVRFLLQNFMLMCERLMGRFIIPMLDPRRYRLRVAAARAATLVFTVGDPTPYPVSRPPHSAFAAMPLFFI